MTRYADQLKEYLGVYKQSVLGVRADGEWRGNGRTYSHILPEENSNLNILEPYRLDFWAYLARLYSVAPLHTDFHHLNSSQAFAFNLLFPFVAEAHLVPLLLDAIGVQATACADPEFEHMPDQEEKTTVDFKLVLDGGRRLLIEVKLTEAEFGSRQPNDERIRKLREHYPEMLKGKVVDGSFEEAQFFRNYQLYRNVAHTAHDRGDRLVLLLPRANVVTWQQGERFIKERLLEDVKPQVSLVAAEDVVARILVNQDSSLRLRTQYERIREKYRLGS